MDGPGIDSRWGRDFPHLSNPALEPTQPHVQWVPGLSRGGGKERPGRDADPSPLLVPWSRKSRAIPLLLLWVVRSEQSLGACTSVHFTLPYWSPNVKFMHNYNNRGQKSLNILNLHAKDASALGQIYFN